MPRHDDQLRDVQRWLDGESGWQEHRALSYADHQPDLSPQQQRLCRLDSVLRQGLSHRGAQSEAIDERMADIAQQLGPAPQRPTLVFSTADVVLAACIGLLVLANVGLLSNHHQQWSPLLTSSWLCCGAGLAVVMLIARRARGLDGSAARFHRSRRFRIPSETLLRTGAWLIVIGGAVSVAAQALN